MTTHLATLADATPTADRPSLLDGMLTRMGQLWSENAIKEAIKEPWITVIHETDGTPDGFYCCLLKFENGLERSILGPGDAPHESHVAWLKAICEMGIAIDAESLRRHPTVDRTKSWIITRIWPDKMGPLNAFIETSFNWKAEANAGPASGKEGYKVVGTCREYWQKRTNLVATAKTVLAALEKTA